jgi:hypothetical protein
MKANVMRRERYAERKLLANALSTGDDALLAAALATKVAKKQMPLCAAVMGSLEHFKQLANTSKALMDQCGGRHKREVAHMLIDGLPASFTKNILGVSASQRRRALNDMDDLKRSITSAKYAEGMDGKSRNQVSAELDMCYRRFFSRTTHQCSGSSNDKAAIMDTEYHVWGAKLDAQWPGILRELAATSPDCVPDLDAMPKTGWTDFQANLLSAVHGCPDDPSLERKERYRKHLHHYRHALAQTNGALPRNTDEENAAIKQTQQRRTASRLTTAAFDPRTYAIHAPCLKTFRKWLDSTELRFTRFSVPHPCPLCEDGPVNEIVYAALSKILVKHAIDGTEVPAELTQRCTKLKTSLRIYRVHVLQLKECRAAAQKAERELAPGTGMVIRDFVNHHDHGGKHVKCLHWVLMWRDKVGEPLKRLKLRHYCSDTKSMSTDSYFQADVMDFHLNEDDPHCPMLFKDFTDIIFVGDHGPHFASHETMHNESTVLRKYGKKIHLMFLASYHAYSRADGAGAEDSSDLRRDLVSGLPRFGARAMTDMTNSSHDAWSWAFEFPAINRNRDIFPLEKNFRAKTRAKWIKKWTEVRFVHPDTTGAYDGVLQYRLVTGLGDWQWTDLVAATRGKDNTLCDRCTTNAQQIVYHCASACPSPGYIHDLPVFADLMPNPARIQGDQVASGKGKGKGTTFPCKFSGCDRTNRKAFRKAHIANRHMQLEHKPTEEEYESLAYPVEDLLVPLDAAVPPPKKRGRPAKGGAAAKPKPKKASKKKAKKRDTTEEDEEASPSWDEADEDDDDGRYARGDQEEDEEQGSAEDDAKDGGNEVDESVEEADPDEVIAKDDEAYEVDELLDHRILNSGKIKYHIRWTKYARTTWELEDHVMSSIRAAYHKKRAAQAVKDAAAAKARRGGRSKRGTANAVHHDEPLSVRLDMRAHALAAKGMSWYRAYEKAQGELGYA